MFFAGYGDWFSKPVVSRGIVQSIQEERGTAKQPYKLTLQNGEELITLYVDKNVEERLKKEDMIEVAYLPGKKEVFRCIVLTRQAENDI
jgi:succinate dehydrogenase/fumarate reductase flavoprotein subunit